MKKSFSITAMFFIAFSVFSTDDKIKSADHMAQQVVNSLQQSSSTSFVELLPALQDFYQIMDASARVYGSSLREAKKEFALTYNNTILPQAKESFEKMLRKGTELGIVWKDAKLVRLDSVEGDSEQAVASFDLVLHASGKEFKIRVTRAIQINGQWKASQFVKLI